MPELTPEQRHMDAAWKIVDAFREPTLGWPMTVGDWGRLANQIALGYAVEYARGAKYQNNLVACVNCKRPVAVSALNAIRCHECVVPEAETGDAPMKEGEV